MVHICQIQTVRQKENVLHDLQLIYTYVKKIPKLYLYINFVITIETIACPEKSYYTFKFDQVEK